MSADDFKNLMDGCHTVTDLERLATRWHEIKAEYHDLVSLRAAFVARHDTLNVANTPEPDRGDSSRAVKTAAVQLTGKPGKVTLEMSIATATKGDPGTLVFLTKVKAKAPETEAPGSIFYADGDFNLVRDDPNQARLPLKELQDQPEQPLREVAQA